MKKKQIVWLGMVLAVLVVVYGVLSLSNQRIEEKEDAEKEEQTVQVTDIVEIASFSYETAGQETLHFEKKEDDWVCTDDEEVELQQTYPDEIADTFAHLTASRKMEEIDALEDYGLTEPSYTVSLQTKDGDKTELSIGNDTGDGYYLQVKGEEDVVYTISSSAVSTLDRSLEDMKKTEEEE